MVSYFVNESTNSCLAVHLLPVCQRGVNTKEDVQTIAVTGIIFSSMGWRDGVCSCIQPFLPGKAFSVPWDSAMALILS